MSGGILEAIEEKLSSNKIGAVPYSCLMFLFALLSFIINSGHDLEREKMQDPIQKRFRGREIVFKSALPVLIVLFLLPAFPTGGNSAGLSISPAYVEVNLDKGRPAGKFIITNLGGEKERYRIKTFHFTFLKGEMMRRIAPDEHSLVPWIKFSPTEFTLGPKSERIIRFLIIPPGNLRTGEYWAAMELESLKGRDKAGERYQFKAVPGILVMIFGRFGKVRYQGILKEIKVAPNETGQAIQLLVGNAGEGRLVIEGQYEIKKSSGEEIQKGSLGRVYIFPGSEEILSSRLGSNLMEGNYKVRVECHSPQLKEPIEKEFQLVWKSPY